jgi:hypothetical protein
MRLLFGTSLALLALVPSAPAQPAKARQAASIYRNPGGDVVGKLALGEDTTVLSRVTTETGSWCRIAAGSVPCSALLISQPPPDPPPPPPPPPPAPRTARVAAKPAPSPVRADPVQGDVDSPPIEHPKPTQIRRAFPGHGDPHATQDTTPQTALVQQYKFKDNPDIAVTLWVRPTGMAAPVADAELTKKLTAPPAARVRPHLLPGGRRVRWSVYHGDFVVTGTSPDGAYEWTMVYSTPESPDDVTSYVLTGATTLDRILFGR